MRCVHVWVVQSDEAFRLLFFASSPCFDPDCLLSPSPTCCATVVSSRLFPGPSSHCALWLALDLLWPACLCALPRAYPPSCPPLSLSSHTYAALRGRAISANPPAHLLVQLAPVKVALHKRLIVLDRLATKWGTTCSRVCQVQVVQISGDTRQKCSKAGLLGVLCGSQPLRCVDSGIARAAFLHYISFCLVCITSSTAMEFPT